MTTGWISRTYLLQQLADSKFPAATTVRSWLCAIITVLSLGIADPAYAQWQSEIVYYGDDGDLSYESDSEGNRIPDFSYVGYRNGEVSLPYVSTSVQISPDDNDSDDTQRIQNAIDSVASLGEDKREFRGAVLLEAGEYEVDGTIELNANGVVLRGEGDGSDPRLNTILKARGNNPQNRDVLLVGGGNYNQWFKHESDEVAITSSIPVGSREFAVEDTAPFDAGDNIIIKHPCTTDWLREVSYGGIHKPYAGSYGWTCQDDDVDIKYNRYIETVDENNNLITIDAPVYNHLDNSLSPLSIFVYDDERANVVRRVGVENLRVDIQFDESETTNIDAKIFYTDEDHAENALVLRNVEDAWVRDFTALHFTNAGVMTRSATRVTIEDVKAIDPVSIVDSPNRYNFMVAPYSQLILFKDCYATKSRHAFVSNGGATASGIVFLRGTSENAVAPSEAGHRKWSQGVLFDNHREKNPIFIPNHGVHRLNLYNRGVIGSNHGWSAVHSIAWNADVSYADLIVQKPPTGQNYAIGTKGKIRESDPWKPEGEKVGYVEGTNRPGLYPASLYEAQRADRLDLDILN